jgi:hypothetical protein
MYFKFSIEEGDVLGTLECVLMTARRGNLKLLNLQINDGASDANVSMQMSADDEDWLGLYLLRLRNIVGVFNVGATREIPCAETARETNLVACY